MGMEWSMESDTNPPPMQRQGTAVDGDGSSSSLPMRFRRRHAGPQAVSPKPEQQAQVLQMPRGPQRRLGEILEEHGTLGDGDVQRILAYQASSKLKFGQAAIALRMASPDDVVWALSQQFHYPGADLAHSTVSPELVTAVDPFSADAEQFRFIRSNLLFTALSNANPRRVLAIVSANRGDGKSYFAANLALSLSQLRGETLLIDADLRTPRMQDLFDLPSSSGLSLVLSGRERASDAFQATAYPGLTLLGAGPVPPNPVELLHGGAFDALLDEMSRRFAYIIVDTPAASHGADAQIVAAHCGTALVMARRHASRLDDVGALTDALRAAAVNTAGVLVNDH